METFDRGGATQSEIQHQEELCKKNKYTTAASQLKDITSIQRSTGLTGCKKFNQKCPLLYAVLAGAANSSSKGILDCLSLADVQHH